MITPELFGHELTIESKIEPSSLLVYRVKYHEAEHILKVSRKNDLFDLDQMETEQRILGACQDVEGITHLVKKYDLSKSEEYQTALLKEYFVGNDLAHEQRLLLPHLRKKLEKTISELHERRVAGLELVRENIVVSPDGNKIKIVDFGSGAIFSIAQEHDFRYWIERDFFSLKSLVERMERALR